MFYKTIKSLVILYVFFTIGIIFIEFSLLLMKFSNFLIKEGYLNSGINDFIMLGIIILIFISLLKLLINFSVFVWKLSLDDTIIYIGNLFRFFKKYIKQGINDSKPIVGKIKKDYGDLYTESSVLYNETKDNAKDMYEKLKKEINKDLDDNESTELSNYILSRGWTKEKENAYTFAETLIFNMGYVKAYDYIQNTTNDYYDTYIDIIEIIQNKEKDTLNFDPSNLIVVDILEKGLHDILIDLTKKNSDIINITFKWEDYKDLIKKEITKLSSKYGKETLEILSEQLIKYACHIISHKNTAN